MPDRGTGAPTNQFVAHFDEEGVTVDFEPLPEDDEDIDPLVEQVQDECPTCGAYVLNEALHRDFHARQRQQFVDLDQLARQYVSPPRYG